MLGIGIQEILIILVVALIVIGPKRLPELARTLGKGFAEFRKAADDLQETVRMDLERDKHEQFREKYPHLVPEEDEKEDAGAGKKAMEDPSGKDVSADPSEPDPAYDPREIEGGGEAEDDTRDA